MGMISTSSNYRPLRNRSIAFVIASFTCGGSERKTVAIVNELAGEHANIHLIVLKDRGPLKKLLDLEKVHFKSINPNFYMDPFGLFKYRRYIHNHDISQVICVNEYPFLFHKLAMAGSKQCRVYGALNTSETNEKKLKRIRHHYYRRFLNKADIIVFGSRNELQKWQIQYGVKTHQPSLKVIYNGVDTYHFRNRQKGSELASLRNSLGVKKNSIVIGTVGRIESEKGHDILLKACAELHRSGMAITILLIGDGKRRSYIESEAHRLGINEHLILPGQQDDVRPYLSLMDFFVLPSLTVEVFSNAALEAMSMEKCVILSDVGGANEMVEEGDSGFVVPPGDIAALTSRLNSLFVTGNWEKYGIEARQRVIKAFSKKEMLDDYSNLLQLNSDNYSN